MKKGEWLARRIAPLAALSLASLVVHADASYQETVQITGGVLVDFLKNIPFLPRSVKQITEPIVSRTVLHGNQLASISKSDTHIIDLDQETITQIDNEKKTYWVETFAQLRQAYKDAPKKLEEAQEKAREQQPAQPKDAANPPPPQFKVTFEVNVVDTGAVKPINGIASKEQVLTMKAHVTDANPPPDKPPQTATYSMITDMWTAPSEPAEMKEIGEFYVRYGKKLMEGVDAAALMKSMQPAISGSALAALFANQPGAKSPGAEPAAEDMAKKLATEMQKIKGTPILQVSRMGGEAMLPPPTGDAATPPPTNAPAQPSTASKLGALGSMLGKSMLGNLRGNSAPAEPPPDSAQPANAVLYESTSQKSDFSREPVSAALFQVPAGFKQVDSPLAAPQSK